MFGWEFPPHNSGGLGVASSGLARALAKLGGILTFVLPKKMPVSSDEFRIVYPEGGEIGVKPVNSILRAYANPTGFNPSFDENYGESLFDEVARYGREATTVAMREHPDVIHAHDWLSFKAGITAKRILKKPLVAHVHATEFDRTGGQHLNQQVYEAELEGFTEADCIITVSEFTKNVLVERYGIAPEKITVVHNGISHEEHRSLGTVAPMLNRLKKRANSIVLFVGRITIQKGPDYFVELARRVLQKNPHVYFVVAGSGDMERQMISLVAYHALSKHFLFTGFLRGEELNQVYRAADVTVMCSVSEPFGIIPLESILNGAPVLISKQSGVGEILKHSLKSDFWDIDDMADKVLAVLKHQSLKGEMLLHSKREAKIATWDKAAKKCLRVYDNLLQHSV